MQSDARIKRLVAEIRVRLDELEELVGETPPALMLNDHLRWLKRAGPLLDQVARENGDVGNDRLAAIASERGYDPRGLGGFFSGSMPSLGKQGARRVLTIHGRELVERWRREFGGDAATGETGAE